MATVKGVRALDRKLQRLAQHADGQTLKRALVAGALPMQNQAKVNAPYVTGNLRRSIHIGGETDVEGSVSDRTGAGVPMPDVGATTAAVYVGTDVVYAAAQEFGYAERNLPAQPYLRPAFDTTRRETLQEIAAALKALIRATAQ